MEQDTIAAIATPLGSGGIGIIRISGERSVSVLSSIFRRIVDSEFFAQQIAAGQNTSHLMHYGHIVHPKDGAPIDEVLVVIMNAPYSYTRETVVEIQSHAGPVILANIMTLILQQGVRIAEPGEFTKRAFLNGRIDLSQAEAVADMVTAKTKTALTLAAVQLTGRMKQTVSDLHFKIDALRAEVEASLEFSEEIGRSLNPETIKRDLQRDIIDPISVLISTYEDAHVLRDGIRVDIVGRPNVGKSSLLNCFLQRDKAIVTDIPGTTRDPVEDTFAIEGIPILLTDTAGLHETCDPIEQAGMRKTRESMERSDIVLFVIDGSAGFTNQDETIWNQIEHKNVVLVVNKIDLNPSAKKIVQDERLNAVPGVLVSAKYYNGIEVLKRHIKQSCLNDTSIEPGQTIVPSLRQKIAFETAIRELQTVHKLIGSKIDYGLVMENLNRAKEELDIISGHGISEDLMDQIFETFCIGK